MAQNPGQKQSYTFMRIKAPDPNSKESMAAFARKVNEQFEALTSKLYGGLEYTNLHKTTQTTIDNKVNNATWNVVITCSGAAETIGVQTEDIVLSVDVYVAGKLITDTLSTTQFAWKRESGDSAADATWNASNASVKFVTLSPTERHLSAEYTCEVTNNATGVLASGSVKLTNQPGISIPVTLESDGGATVVQARFIASDTTFGLFKVSDGTPIAIGGVGADGNGYFAANQLRDVSVNSDLMLGLKASEDSANYRFLLSMLYGADNIGGLGVKVGKTSGVKQLSISSDDADISIDASYPGSGYAFINLSRQYGNVLLGGQYSGTEANLAISGAEGWIYTNCSVLSTRQLRPQETATYSIGNNANRYLRAFVTQSESVSSDARLKTEIEDLDGSLIYKVRPRRFKLINGDGKWCYGVIAQELRAVMDELGIENIDLYDDENPESLAIIYQGFIGPLIAAVQEQKARADALRAELDELKAHNTALEARLSALEAKIG